MDDHARDAVAPSRIWRILIVLLIFACGPTMQPQPLPAQATALPTYTVALPLVASTPAERTIHILVDDFQTHTFDGEPFHFFNRLNGDRGPINGSMLAWGAGQVTTTVSQGNSWGGVWMSLNHPLAEALPLDFSTLLPAQVLPAYQSRITGLTVQIASGSPGRQFRVELKDRNEIRWSQEVTLSGGAQVISADLPALGDISQLVWVLDRASAGDTVVLDAISLTATTRIADTATAAFVWSYGMLLNNWSPASGLVRDKAKHAGGEFDAIQATGCLAAATAVAEQLGVIKRSDAIQIVNRISQTLLIDTPRFHGLWPHFVNTSASGAITIAPNTEWSSVDTIIAAVGLLTAQQALGIDSSSAEHMVQTIDWADLTAANGMIAHGYAYSGERLGSAWDVFGGESWLADLAYAGATGRIAPMPYAGPPSANGSGFIDELAWLFVRPPAGLDYWGADWAAYRLAAADRQLAYFSVNYPTSCFSRLGLFGLSAGEVPAPSEIPSGRYQAFGVGGRFADPIDGLDPLGAPVATPHYAGMIASLRPVAAIRMWGWLIDNGLLSPLTNVESALFPGGSSCDASVLKWNSLKGSWNLALQTLGWGRYLAERNGQVPILWQATTANPLLRKGYTLLTARQPALKAIEPWSYACE